MVGGPIGVLILFLLALTCFGLVVAFVLVPLFKGIGWLIGGLFTGAGWLVRHVYVFISGMLKDTVRFVGAIIAWVVMLPLVVLTIIIGRWSASGHFWRSMNRELKVGTTCLYRVLLQRPLRFLLLAGLLEGLEERVGEAMVAAPTSDKPSRRMGTFEGYEIIGSLPGGGSGAKLYIARPEVAKRAGNASMPDRVVIKCFMLSDGSTLPQIVRESRALEAAKQLGLVLDHDMDEHRFFYVMPYHQGEHLGIITHQLHGESSRDGLGRKKLDVALGYISDLVRTLARYHRGGLWHKDVKPDNVIIHDGRAHLVDLGLVTPLRSAMTLTTHGTEYFRDPEMVRMALRGVKVHQVDGAKFDIYAAGAVLYFVLENTFPAHGGLSAFASRSPESVRWIVRRAMADYHKRYESAELMLADLEHVRQASDPYAVKPAELPSMRGGAPADLIDEPVEVDAGRAAEEEVVASARTPKIKANSSEPEIKGFGVKIGRDGVQVGSFSVPPKTPAPASASGRPQVRVTNWWTGAYEVDDPGVAAAAAAVSFKSEAKEFRTHVREMRGQDRVLRDQIRNRTIGARKAAREQIRAARNRAREMRRRAHEHRLRALKSAPAARSSQPAPAVAGATMALLLLAVAGGFVFLNRSQNRDAQVAPMVSGFESSANPLTLLLINDHPAVTDPFVQAELDRIVQDHRRRGYVIIDGNREAEVEVRKWLPVGPADSPPRLFGVTLRKFDLGGVLRFKSTPGDGPAIRRIDTELIVPDPE